MAQITDEVLMGKELIDYSDRERKIDETADAFSYVLPALSPFWGTVAGFILQSIPRYRQKRIEEFLSEMERDLSGIGMDIEAIKKHIDGIQDQVIYIIEKAIFTSNKQKALVFRSILRNEIIGNELDEDVKEYFINIIETRMTVLHIKILSFMNRPEDYLSANGIPIERLNGGFLQMFQLVFPSIPVDVLRSAYKDLFDIGFINTDTNIWDTMTSDHGIRLLGDRVKQLGKMFIKYCS